MEKMDARVTMLLMLVILVIFISSSEAETTCVQCASLLSQSCGDPYSESSSHSTCSADFCVKSKYQYRGTEVVVRACSPMAAWSGCREVNYEGHSATTCFCDSYKCNRQ